MTTISIDDGTLHVNDFQTTDNDIVQFFQDVDDQDRNETLLTALRLGVIALKSSRNAENVDYVEKRFEQLEQDFEEQLDEMLGEDGTLVSEVFDPSKEGTPLEQLKVEVRTGLRELREKVVEEEAEEAIKEQTRFKGEEFEDDLYDLLGEITDFTGDTVDYTGEDTGELTGSKKGDFVVNLATIDSRIVIEAKDTYVTQPDIKEELEEGMENRNASYGILIAKSRENLPQKIGWFNELEDDKLVIVLSDEDTDDYAQQILRIGYRWAKLRAHQQHSLDTDEFEAEDVKAEIDKVRESIDTFSQIRKQCTNISNARKDIEDKLDDVQQDVETHLDDALRALQPASN